MTKTEMIYGNPEPIQLMAKLETILGGNNPIKVKDEDGCFTDEYIDDIKHKAKTLTDAEKLAIGWKPTRVIHCTNSTTAWAVAIVPQDYKEMLDSNALEEDVFPFPEDSVFGFKMAYNQRNDVIHAECPEVEVISMEEYANDIEKAEDNCWVDCSCRKYKEIKDKADKFDQLKSKYK